MLPFGEVNEELAEILVGLAVWPQKDMICGHVTDWPDIGNPMI